MISSNSRKIFSLAGSALMVGASIVGMSAPAQAAAGDVTLKPATGETYNVFNDDIFNLQAVVNSVTIANNNTLSYIIQNPDQHDLVIDFKDVNAGITATKATFIGLKSTGEAVSVGIIDGTEKTIGASTNKTSRADDASTDGAVLIDFDDDSVDITTLIIGDITMDADQELTIDIKPLADSDDDTNDTAVLTATEAKDLTTGEASSNNHAELGLTDGNASITVQAWLDTNSDITDIETEYASNAATINWYDPNNVSVISKIQNMNAFGRAVLSSTDTVTRQDLVMAVNGDDSIEGVTGSVKFNVPINFSQIQMTDFKLGLVSSTDTALGFATSAITQFTAYAANGSAGAAALDADREVEELGASNGKSADKNGEMLIRVGAADDFDANDKFKFEFQHADTATVSGATVNAPVYSSPEFTIVSQTVDTGVDGLAVTAGPSSDVSDTADTATVRTGVKVVTYTAQAQDGGVDVEKANIPVLARVDAGAFLPTGESYQVSGTTVLLDQANESVFVSGLTDADGHFDLTVTSALGAAGGTYNVQFFVAEGTDGALQLGDFASATEMSAVHAATSASTFAATADVNSSASPTITFEVKDAFGELVSTSATGKQYSVELKAPDTDNLEAYGVVENGTVSFSFDNWLSTGESDVLTAKLYTGTSTSPASTDYVSGKQDTITLYAPVAVSAVAFTLDEITGVDVNYNDFITGTRSKIGPASTTGTDVAGSVVDANGAGIPGTPVTLTAEGMQFRSGTTYSIGSVDLVTDAAGTFTAEVWTNVKNADGVVITATSGSSTDTIRIDTDLPDAGGADDSLTRGNLVFDVDMPSTVVVNTTYAVTASVKDVFGNPVDGATIKFDGFGSAQFNGVASVTKNTNRNGEAVVYLRSLKDIDGLSAVEISVTAIDHNGDGDTDTGSIAQPVTTDVATTSWDETSWSNLVETEVNFLASAADAAAADAKVNAGSFKGYVAVYAKGYEGQRLSAKIGNDWVIVPSLASNFERVVDFTGAGVDIAVRIYIDRVLLDTINLTTK